MSIRVDIEKTLGRFQLRVQLAAENEVLALLGASGCGKSMTLRCIAGVERPDRGLIEIDGETVFDSKRRINLPPQARRAGLLFQSYALFPNMTVQQNICAGVRCGGTRAERSVMAEQIMERFELAPLARHYPAQLSGGQQQRVALARLLVSAPRVLLLDEPFSALDAHLRMRLERELREVLRQFGRTALFVSHDRREAFRIADRIALMEQGCVLRLDQRETVFNAPQTRSAARLTGCENISAVGRRNGALWALDWNLPLSLPEDCDGLCAVGIRRRDVRLGAGEGSVRCRVEELVEEPFSCTLYLRPPGAVQSLVCAVEKARWNEIQAQELELSLPGECLLPLYG